MKKFKTFIAEASAQDKDFIQQSLADMDLDSTIDGSVVKVRGDTKDKNKVAAFLRKNGLARDYKVEILKEAAEPVKDKKDKKSKETTVIVNPDKEDI